LITKVSPKILIGLTATPFRTKKGESFEDMYDVIVNPISTRKLIARKFLVPYKIICPKVDVDFSGIKIKHSVSGEADFDQTELFKRYDNDRVYQTVIDKWKEHGENRPTVVFCTNDKRHVNNTVDWFVKNGIKAEGITSDTTTEQQKQTMKNFADGYIKVLVNIGMISEGISIDRTSCIMFVCATASLVRWVQASARGNRALWNSDYTDWLKSGGNYVKKDCILIDLGMNVSRPGLGSPEDYDLMGFDLTGKPKSNGTAPMKSCKKCDFANHASARFCKNCGNKFEITIKDEKVYADEVEMYEVDKMDLFIDKILNSSANAIKERFKVVHRPDLLRITAEIKGWGIDWAVYAAKTYGYTTLDPKTQSAQIFELLDQEEQDSGMWVYREYLKQKYVQKRH
jgi:superfamily II DNA or RNA helicase